MAVQWLVKSGDEEHGPFSSAQLKELAERGMINAKTPIRRETDKRWLRADKVQGLFPITKETAEDEFESPINDALMSDGSNKVAKGKTIEALTSNVPDASSAAPALFHDIPSKPIRPYSHAEKMWMIAKDFFGDTNLGWTLLLLPVIYFSARKYKAVGECPYCAKDVGLEVKDGEVGCAECRRPLVVAKGRLWFRDSTTSEVDHWRDDR